MDEIGAIRAARERGTYNTGLKRGRYNRFFGHSRALYRKKRQSVLNSAMRAADGRRALELGSTAWLAFIEQARVTPEAVVCINISERELGLGVERSEGTRVKPAFCLMDAHRLGFESDRFDVVFGTAILHHLDLRAALLEIRRVLKPDGRFVFVEPLDNNPIGRAVRRATPFARTIDERPFRFEDLDAITDLFECEFHFEQLVSVPLGAASALLYRDGDNFISRLGFKFDEWLVQRWPQIGPYFREVLIVGKPAVETGRAGP